MINYEDLIGKPYSDNGRGPASFDCYGLLKECYRRKGIELPELTTPSTKEECEQKVDEWTWQWERLEEPETEAAVLIRIDQYRSHVGFCVEEGYFIHAVENLSVVRSGLDSLLWRNRIVGFYRYTGTPCK